MRKIFFVIFTFSVFMFFGCSEEHKNDIAAAKAAKEYYDSLLAGNNKFFVRGMYLADTIPDGYREELEANAKMFVERVKEEHHGIREVRIMNCVNDTIKVPGTQNTVHAANAFLVFCFGDSLNEEVVVPMVEHKGRWLMR